jgi:hypothetical protein
MLGRPDIHGAHVTSSQAHGFPRPPVAQRDPMEWLGIDGHRCTHRRSFQTGNLQRPEVLKTAE